MVGLDWILSCSHHPKAGMGLLPKAVSAGSGSRLRPSGLPNGAGVSRKDSDKGAVKLVD